jgi:hypothetical protein
MPGFSQPIFVHNTLLLNQTPISIHHSLNCISNQNSSLSRVGGGGEGHCSVERFRVREDGVIVGITSVLVLVCTDSDGELGAGLTLQHHSLDSYGGHEMVQQHLTL